MSQTTSSTNNLLDERFNFFNRNPLYVSLLIIPLLVLFIITIIFIFLTNIYRKNSFVYVRTILFSFLLITNVLTILFYATIMYFKQTNIKNNQVSNISEKNKYISKIYLIISSIIFSIYILYLLLSHTFGCF